MGNWRNILISPDVSILQAIKIIDKEGMRAALVIDQENHLLGMITDGDIRRCILKNISLAEPVYNIMNKKPTIAYAEDDRDKLLAKLQSLQLYHLPIVDFRNHIVGFETFDSLLSFPRRDNLVVIMAGGMGKRLHPLTIDCPKPLIRIGNKPVLEILIKNFIKHGFHQFCIAVNYKSDMIKSYFDNGDRWGVTINYLEESIPLGTAGALSLLSQQPTNAFFVVNADVMTTIDFESLLRYHEESNVDATLCIREHAQVIPYGVVQRDKDTHLLLNIIEKPTKQFFVNAGIYILEPQVLNFLKCNQYLDMPDLLSQCIDNSFNIVTFPIKEYWLDIGKHEDLQQAHADYEKVF